MAFPTFRFRDTTAMLQQWGREMPRALGYEETKARDNFTTWQRKSRRKLKELLGFWPVQTDPQPLQAWQLAHEEAAGYTREEYVVQSPFGDHLFLYRLLPDCAPRAVMLALHGHGFYGADPVAGVMKGRYNEESSLHTCNYDYGAEFARRGYIVYALCQRGFGQRCDVDNPATGADYDPQENPVPPPGSSCLDINSRAILLGTTDMALRLQDAMHVIDWIHSTPAEKAMPLGCVGLSGGGHTTELLAALDTRIHAASIQGYFCYWVDQIMDITHCNCNYVPGLLRWFEQDDICGLICPRPLLVSTADNDGVAPLKSFRKAFKSLKQIYRDQGVERNLEQDVFEGGHEFTGRKAFDFFARHLG